MTTRLLRHRTPVEQMAVSRRKTQAMEERALDLACEKEQLYKAEWENKTQDRIEARQEARTREKHADEAAAALRARRARLGALYQTEHAAWIAEIQNAKESPEQRRERLRARALALKERREAERGSFVKAARQRQWRDSCDEARTLDSQALLLYVTDARRHEIEEQARRRGADAEEAARFAEVWRGRMRALEEREAADERARYEANEACRLDLDEQVRIKGERRLDLIRRMQEEAQVELDELSAAVERDEAEQRARREAAHARGRQVKEFNNTRLHLREEQARLERQQDLLLLQYAQAQERQQIAREQAKKATEVQATQEYTQHLQDLMVREAQDTSELDAIREHEENRVWEKRDRELQAQAEARRRLQAIVHAGREDQIRERQLRDAEETAYEKEQERQDALVLSEGLRQDREAAEKRRHGRVENNRMLQEQMAARELARREEVEWERREAEQWREDMRALDERAQAQAGEVKLYYPRKHSNWYT